MAVEPDINRGQQLSTPQGQAIGFVDTKAQFDAVTTALKAAGFAESAIIALKGENGVDMLKRLQETSILGTAKMPSWKPQSEKCKRDITPLGSQSTTARTLCALLVCPSLSVPIVVATSALG